MNKGVCKRREGMSVKGEVLGWMYKESIVLEFYVELIECIWVFI